MATENGTPDLIDFTVNQTSEQIFEDAAILAEKNTTELFGELTPVTETVSTHKMAEIVREIESNFFDRIPFESIVISQQKDAIQSMESNISSAHINRLEEFSLSQKSQSQSMNRVQHNTSNDSKLFIKLNGLHYSNLEFEQDILLEKDTGYQCNNNNNNNEVMNSYEHSLSVDASKRSSSIYTAITSSKFDCNCDSYYQPTSGKVISIFLI